MKSVCKVRYTKYMNNILGLNPNNRIKTGFVENIYRCFRWSLRIASEITDNRQRAVYTAHYLGVKPFFKYRNTIALRLRFQKHNIICG
jgi:hypothetical protein